MTLHLARRVQRELETVGGHRVLMTRPGDLTRSLQQRVDYRQSKQTDYVRISATEVRP